MSQSATPERHDAAADFHRRGVVEREDDGIYLPLWSVDDWRALFQHASVNVLQSGESLLRRGDLERTLYFVASGKLEVSAAASRGGAMGSMVRVAPGSVIGEISFFDGRGRSATVWAVEPTELVCLGYDGFQAFAEQAPQRSRELLFALGRTIAFRLRRGESRRDQWPY